MLEVAHDLRSFKILPGLADCRSLEDFYERLASLLAFRVLARSRQGFHREYVGTQDHLLTVRGRIDLASALRAQWEPRLRCDFEENTADIEDNQLLLWTLHCIGRNSACRRSEVREVVRTAYGRLQSVATLRALTAADCTERSYSRLNDDYRPSHALCRFFLEHTGPSHEGGDHHNLPFLVDMARLFERFVAGWLRLHLPASQRITAQERVVLDPQSQLAFDIDLVLYDATSGRALAVLDTKYKAADRPSTQDIAQVVAYATAKSCTEAVLVYPAPLRQPLDMRVQEIRVRTLSFPLNGDLDAAGQSFLTDLGALACAHRSAAWSARRFLQGHHLNAREAVEVAVGGE